MLYSNKKKKVKNIKEEKISKKKWETKETGVASHTAVSSYASFIWFLAYWKIESSIIQYIFRIHLFQNHLNTMDLKLFIQKKNTWWKNSMGETSKGFAIGCKKEKLTF